MSDGAGSRGRVLVTGGAGYIGSHTVADLVEHGFEPIVVDDFSNSDRRVMEGLARICGRPIECHEVDCGDRAALGRVFETAGPMAGVIHFAASKAVGESQEKPLHYYRNNVGGLITLLEVMDEYGTRDLVFSSSCTVYGQPDCLPVTEETPRAEPASVYGATKRICEDVLMDLVASGAPHRVALLRYFNPIGAHPSAEIGELPLGNPQNLVPVLLQSAAGLRGPLQIHGDDWDTPDGTCVRDYLHVLDLAAAHVRTLDWMSGQDETPLIDVFNLGTGRGTSVAEALAAFERATGRRVPHEVGPRRPGDIAQIYAACEKSQRVLDWKATRSIEEALGDAWQWQARLAET